MSGCFNIRRSAESTKDTDKCCSAEHVLHDVCFQLKTALATAAACAAGRSSSKLRAAPVSAYTVRCLHMAKSEAAEHPAGWPVVAPATFAETHAHEAAPILI